MELKFDRVKNLKERLEFIHYYAEWVKRVPNEIWSKQQAMLINSFMQNCKNFKMDSKEYLKMIEYGKRRKIK
ncbi:MAG: hypothetical protein J7K95_07955 [Thermoplasmata archaeon]|nr:hypothetical protein [Thermoplasmata archaeon]